MATPGFIQPEQRREKMDTLTTYGLVSVSLMLLFYALEERSTWFVLAFSVSCVMASVYGFLQGAWPFGLVEMVWSIVALRRWWKRRSKIKK
jgi:hypothetical protein